MLSQLNLRFHKKLIEALKVRAGRENTSVNAWPNASSMTV